MISAGAARGERSVLFPSFVSGPGAGARARERARFCRIKSDSIFF